MRSFGVAIFLGAFLLFLVQPLVGKALLPSFGGTPAVWATCMVFFQTTLLLGYALAHGLRCTLGDTGQRRAFLGLLTVAIAAQLVLGWEWTSPITPGSSWVPDPNGAPIAQILVLLAASTGIPFLALSATGPLLQAWFARANPGRSPYPLYALSNAGSLFALLAFPLVLEPLAGGAAQGWMWCGAFSVFALMVGLASRQRLGSAAAEAPATTAVDLPPPRTRTLAWFALSLASSTLLSATMNHLGEEIVVAPFLWIAPLGVYLASLILAYAPGVYDRRTWAAQALFAGIALVAMLMGAHQRHLGLQLGVYLYALLVGCMMCHGELARLAPPARWLTRYYLTSAAGGAVGGMLVGLAAPTFLIATHEYHIAVVLATWAVIGAIASDANSGLRRAGGIYIAPLAALAAVACLGFELRDLLATPVGAALGWPSQGYLFACILIAMPLALLTLSRRLRTVIPPDHAAWTWALVLVALIPLHHTLYIHAARQVLGARFQTRTFYGVLRVADSQREDMRHMRTRALTHGFVVHGLQVHEPALRQAATTYYGATSGLGQAIEHHPRRVASEPLRIGAIGLGVGTVAALAHPGDVVRFYEINVAVVHLALPDSPYFSFLRDSSAQVEVVLGDARLQLAGELASGVRQDFDVIVIDAFTGGAIPTHLLSLEAVELYLAHLRDSRGVLAFHISNHYVRLAPVLHGAADRLGLARLETKVVALDTTPWIYSSEWMLLSRDAAQLAGPALTSLEVRSTRRPPVVWTDDRSNLLEVLKWGGNK